MSQMQNNVPMQPLGHAEKGQDVASGSKGAQDSASLPQPAVANATAKAKMHPAVIIAIWIALSSSVIVYNK